ncbi:hypothetical protein GPL15_01040 [Clostridium sp. MCC353]|uniref:hypothetical protein n=1 Tax=Clostridium sp. MCC353 TaxID=2592646 RepID=UPI001C02420D|nr:hypothetical protein [Clostridium sp. MCC353]MBT9775095.1 hypothetical protein [Clostridium sp. MCC353]
METKKSGGCLLGLIVWGVSALIIGFLLNSINKTGQSMGTLVMTSLILGLMAAFVVFCFMMIILTSKAQKAGRLRRAEDKAA